MMKLLNILLLTAFLLQIMDITNAVNENSMEHEKCCPWSILCRCPQKHPPEFQLPWICDHGIMKTVDYGSYDDEMGSGEMDVEEIHKDAFYA